MHKTSSLREQDINSEGVIEKRVVSNTSTVPEEEEIYYRISLHYRTLLMLMMRIIYERCNFECSEYFLHV